MSAYTYMIFFCYFENLLAKNSSFHHLKDVVLFLFVWLLKFIMCLWHSLFVRLSVRPPAWTVCLGVCIHIVYVLVSYSYNP